MYMGYTQEQKALRDELRAYYARLLTPEIQHELHKGEGVGPLMRQVVRLRKMKPDDRSEMETILEVYKAALGMG